MWLLGQLQFLGIWLYLSAPEVLLHLESSPVQNVLTFFLRKMFISQHGHGGDKPTTKLAYSENKFYKIVTTTAQRQVVVMRRLHT